MEHQNALRIAVIDEQIHGLREHHLGLWQTVFQPVMASLLPGLAVTLVSSSDTRLVVDIEKLIKKKIELEPLDLAAITGVQPDTPRAYQTDGDLQSLIVELEALAAELGGIDRMIVNAGLGKGGVLGTGKLAANLEVSTSSLWVLAIPLAVAFWRNSFASAALLPIAAGVRRTELRDLFTDWSLLRTDALLRKPAPLRRQGPGAANPHGELFAA